MQLGGGPGGDSAATTADAGAQSAALAVPIGVGDRRRAVVVVAAEAADLRRAGDIAGRIGVGDGAGGAVDADEAADGVGATGADHPATGVGVGDGTLAEADQAADRTGGAADGAGGVGLADRSAGAGVVAVGADQPADVALAAAVAGHAAGGERFRDHPTVHDVADESADIVAGAGDAAAGRGGGDRASVVDADQTADLARAGSRADNGCARSRVGDRALPKIADQGADIALAGDRAAGQGDVADRRARVRIAEQPDVGGGGPVDGQPGDLVVLAVKAAGELGSGCADRHEAAGPPQAGVSAGIGGEGAAEIDVGAELVAGLQIQRHQLQRRRGCDHRRMLVAQHGTCRGFVHHPGVGEIEAVVGRLLPCVDGGDLVAVAARLAGGAAVPIGVGRGRQTARDRTADQAADIGRAGHLAAGIHTGQRTAHIGPADQTARERARSGHRAGGIGVGDVGVARPTDQAAGLRHTGDGGRRGGAEQRRGIRHTDDAAGLLDRPLHAARHMDVADRRAAGRAQDGTDAAAARNVDIGQRDVADDVGRVAEQRHIHRAGAIDEQPVNSMAQAMELTAHAGNRREARAAVPSGGCRGVDVRDDRVIGGGGVTDVVQVVETADQREGRTTRREGGVAARQRDARAAAQMIILAAAIIQDQSGAVPGRGDVLVDVDVARRIERQRRVGAPMDRGCHRDVAGLAAARPGGDGDAGRGQRVGQGGDVDHGVVGGGREAAPAVGRRRDGDVVGVDQPVAGLALVGQRRHLGAGGDRHRGGGGFDMAAVTAIRSGGVDATTDLDLATLHSGEQIDPAGLAAGPMGDGLRLDRAGVGHHRRHGGARPLRGHQHPTAAGGNQPAILDQRRGGRAIDLDLQMAVGPGIQRHLGPGGQGHVAVARVDGSLVGNGAADQHHRSAILGVDGALVDD